MTDTPMEILSTETAVTTAESTVTESIVVTETSTLVQTVSPTAAPTAAFTPTVTPTEVLHWILSDHLGSTSTTANADGTFYSAIQYTAFGEIRLTRNTTLTDYRYREAPCKGHRSTRPG